MTFIITLIWLVIICAILFPFYKFFKADANEFNKILDIKWLLLAYVGINVFVINFISSEEAIYIWDYKGYWELTIKLSNAFYKDPMDGLDILYCSILEDDYNFLPCFFLVPFIKLFGYSRIVYELLLLNLFFVPSIYFSLLFFHTSVKKLSRNTITIASIVLLFFPLALEPTLKGYLDIIGLSFFWLLLYVIKKIKDEDFDLKTALLFFQVLIITLFLRRWYGIWIQSLAISTICYYLLDILLKKDYKKDIIKYLKYFAVIAPLSIIIFIVFKKFFLRSLGVDYSDIYSGYSEGGPIENIYSLVSAFGYLYISIIVLGFIFLVSIKESRFVSLMLIFNLILSIIFFTQIQAFDPHHKIILLPAVFVFMIAVIDRLVSLQYKTIKFLILIIFGSLFYSAQQRSFQSFILPEAHLIPTRNPNFKTIKELNLFFKQLAPNQDNCIMALISSDKFNTEMIKSANFPQELQGLSSFLKTCDVDKRDGLPLDLFSKARYVLVTEKAQIHLAEKDQWVVSKFNQWIYEGPFTNKYKLVKEFQNPETGKIKILELTSPYTNQDLDFIEKEFGKRYASYPNLSKIPREELLNKR